jgi:hypothetical protein
VRQWWRSEVCDASAHIEVIVQLQLRSLYVRHCSCEQIRTFGHSTVPSCRRRHSFADVLKMWYLQRHRNVLCCRFPWFPAENFLPERCFGVFGLGSHIIMSYCTYLVRTDCSVLHLVRMFRRGMTRRYTCRSATRATTRVAYYHICRTRRSQHVHTWLQRNWATTSPLDGTVADKAQRNWNCN